MIYAVKLAELFDIDVNQLAKLVPFIAVYSIGGLQNTEPVVAKTLEHEVHSDGRDADFAEIALPIRRWRGSISMRSTVAGAVGCRRRWGRDG